MGSGATLIQGLSLHQWADAPAGEFAKAVRATLDKHWASDGIRMKPFIVDVRLSPCSDELTAIEVYAYAEEDARATAYADKECFGHDNAIIERVKEDMRES